MPTARAFRGFRCPAEVLLWAVRWSLPFPISCRGLEQRLADRGVAVDPTPLSRWVQRFAPELEKRLRRHLRPCRGPWPVDETDIRVDGRWRYSTERSTARARRSPFCSAPSGTRKPPQEAARRFFRRALTRRAAGHEARRHAGARHAPPPRTVAQPLGCAGSPAPEALGSTEARRQAVCDGAAHAGGHSLTALPSPGMTRPRP
jgi:hypothetical protein